MLSSRKKVAVEEGGSKPQRRASLLIPANPAFADPGSSPISRGGILLNPLGGPPPPPFSPSSATSTSSYTSGSTSSLGSERGRGASAIGKRSSISSTGSDDGPGSGTSSPRLKFAPLPVSGRQRSSSITLGVAARAAMLGAQGSYTGNVNDNSTGGMNQPHWQQGVAPVKLMWYNGGPMPDNVKSVKDIKPGFKKVFGKMRRASSSSQSQEGYADGMASSDGPNDSSMNSSASMESLASSTSSASASIPEEDVDEHMQGTVIVPPDREKGERGRPIERSTTLNQQQSMEMISRSVSGGSMAGEATPQMQSSPSSSQPATQTSSSSGPYLHFTNQRSPPGSGANTPRRRMSMTDLHDPQYEVHRSGHQQAILGFDESHFSNKFNNLGLHRYGGNQNSLGEEGQGEAIGENAQVRAGAVEVVVGGHGSVR